MLPVSYALQSRMADTAVATVTAITSDNLRRMDGCVQNKNLFWGGVFYGVDYFFKLQEAGFTQRPDFGVESGIFLTGMAPSSCFETMPDPTIITGIKSLCFPLKAGFTPSEGLKRVQKGPSFLDCTSVCQISYYEALKEVLGPEKFDVIFSASGPNRLSIGGSNIYNPLMGLMQDNPLSQSIVKGQVVCFKNLSLYLNKHPMGNGRAYQTICCDATPGAERFVTLGLPSCGLTRDEMVDRLIADFNEKPLKPEFLNSKLAKWATEDITQSLAELKIEDPEDLKVSMPEGRAKFKEAEGGKIIMIGSWSMDRVEELIDATPDIGQDLLKMWNEEVRIKRNLHPYPFNF